VAIDASREELRADYAAYRACGRRPLATVMVSSAVYPALTGPLPAVMSPLAYQRELPAATGRAHEVTISDDLQSAAIGAQRAPARHAINAGLDLLMYAQSETASAAAYAALLDEARTGVVSRARVRAAYGAILALKRRAARPTST
jgi:beta-glucosidase-like glycosyl hydrolase